MRPFNNFSWLMLAACALCAACRSFGPIPDLARAADTPAFMGEPWTAQDLPVQAIEPHPWLAPQGVNGMHDDSWGSNTVAWSGPLGHQPLVRSVAPAATGGEFATLCFDRTGRLIGISGQFDRFVLYLLDPVSLQPLASLDLPPRPSMRQFMKTFDYGVIMKDTSGGGYFHLLAGDRPLIADAERHIRIFRVDESGPFPRWVEEANWDLNPVMATGDTVTDACPDWQGRIWFITRHGMVGWIDQASGRISRITLDGEEIENSFSIASDGVYIVSDHALYRFEADPATGTPVASWREEYDRGSEVKPGHINQGSGTTPTLFGDGLVAITDNNDQNDRLLVYHRRPDWSGERLVCTLPLFDAGRSSSENSITAWGNALFVENNWMLTDGAPTHPSPRSWPGVVRVDVDAPNRLATLSWESREASPTVVPKLSGNGLLYLYTRERLANPEQPSHRIAAWYLTALDARTGRTVFKIHTGNGPNFNNNYAPITIGPEGTAYVGCFNGLIAVKDQP